MKEYYYYIIGCLVLFWAIGYISSIYFRKTAKLKLEEASRFGKGSIFLTVCAIIGAVFLEMLLFTDLVTSLLNSPPFLLLFSVFSVLGIFNGLGALFSKKLPYYRIRKNYGIGSILLSFGIWTIILYVFTNILLVRFISMFIILTAIIFMVKSLNGQIRHMYKVKK